MIAKDLSVTFPSQGVIRLQSRSLFEDADNPTCRSFLERVFQADGVSAVTIAGGDAPQAEVHYHVNGTGLHGMVNRIVGVLQRPANGNGTAPSFSNGQAATHGHAPSHANGESNGHGQANGIVPIGDSAHPNGKLPTDSPKEAGHGTFASPSHYGPYSHEAETAKPLVARAANARDTKGVVKYYRVDSLVTGWEVKTEGIG
jgi:hypothetical protein